MQAQQGSIAATSARGYLPEPSTSTTAGSSPEATTNAPRADSLQPMAGDRAAGDIEYDSWQVQPELGR